MRGHVAASQPTLGCHLTLGLAKPLLYQFTCILGIDYLAMDSSLVCADGDAESTEQ